MIADTTTPTETPWPIEQAVRLTRRGEAVVLLLRLDRLVAELNPDDRRDVREQALCLLGED